MDQHLELRKSARRRVLKQGKVVLQGTSGLANVLVRDMAPGGVKFEIAATADLPEKFSFIMVTDGTITPVKLSWRRGNFAGVKFCGETMELDRRGFEASRGHI